MIGRGCGVLIAADDTARLATALKLVVSRSRAAHRSWCGRTPTSERTVRRRRGITQAGCPLSRGGAVNRPSYPRRMFVVPDLHTGGAERHVTTLLPRMDPARFTPSVVCIGDEGALFGALPAAGIEARALRLAKRNALRAVSELVSIFRRTEPDVVVVRGYNAEALGRIAARHRRSRPTPSCGCTTSPTSPRAVESGPPLDQLARPMDKRLLRCCRRSATVPRRRAAIPRRTRFGSVHNGVDPSLFDSAPTGPPSASSVG